MEFRANTRPQRGRWAAGLLAVFLAAGTLKASPVLSGLQVDLTLVCAVVIVLGAAQGAIEILLTRSTLHLAWIVGAMSIVLWGLWRAPESAYAAMKIQSLAALTIGCGLVGAMLLLRTPVQRLWLVRGTIGVGLVVLALYFIAPTSDAALMGRVALEGSNTIAAGRYAGAGLISVLVLMLSRRMRPLIGLPLAAALVSLMVGTGSRGPLVATGVALLVLVPLVLQGRHQIRSAFILGGIVAMGAYAFSQSAVWVQQRLELLVAADKGASVYQRQAMWAESWDVFQLFPLGVGWGGLAPHLAPLDRYPHNLLIEVAGEAGIVGLVGLLFMLVAAYARGWKHAAAGDVMAKCFVALLTFWLVNAMVSGDLNDNRGVFVFTAACIALGRISPTYYRRSTRLGAHVGPLDRGPAPAVLGDCPGHPRDNQVGVGADDLAILRPGRAQARGDMGLLHDQVTG